VAGALHDLQARRDGDQFDGFLQFLDRAERIARPMYENCGNTQLRKVIGSKLCWLPRRMQGIREQQKTVGKSRVFGRYHTRLAAAVGLPCEIERDAWSELTQLLCSLADAFAIAVA
jgi:hypothetical protein